MKNLKRLNMRVMTETLDIGCGGGAFNTTCLGNINTDISFPKRKPDKPFILSDAHHLPFKSNLFKKITMYDVIEHLDSPITALKEIKRVLSKDGYAVIVTPNAMRILNALFVIRHGYYIPHVDHGLAWARIEFSYLMRKAGFKKYKVIPRTMKDEKHSLVANLFLCLPYKDLTERQLVAVIKK